MAKKRVTTVAYEGEDVDAWGRSHLYLRIDGERVADLMIEQPMARYGYLYLDVSFEDDYEIAVPAEPRDHRAARVVPGGTDHPEALHLYWAWWHRVNQIPGEGPP